MVYSLKTSHGYKLVDIPPTIRRRSGLTIVAYWRDGKATVVKRGVRLDNELLDSVKVIVHGERARVLTIPAKH